MQETSNLSFLPFLFFFQGVGAFKSFITLLVRSLLISFILFNELFIVITSAFPCCDWVLEELRFCFSFFKLFCRHQFQVSNSESTSHQLASFQFHLVSMSSFVSQSLLLLFLYYQNLDTSDLIYSPEIAVLPTSQPHLTMLT